MLQIGLGPKKVEALNDQLGIASIEQLEATVRASGRPRRIRRKPKTKSGWNQFAHLPCVIT